MNHRIAAAALRSAIAIRSTVALRLAILPVHPAIVALRLATVPVRPAVVSLMLAVGLLCMFASGGCSKFEAFRFPEPVRDGRSIMAGRGDCDAMRLTPRQREFCQTLTVSGAEPVASAAWGSAAIPVLWKGGKTGEQDEQGLPERDFVVVGTVGGDLYSPLYLFQRTIVEDQFRRAAKAVDADAVAYAEAGPWCPCPFDLFTAVVRARGLLIKYEADATPATTQPMGP